ncbi:zinc finger protein GLI4-like [Struthio camelus]|uniref:zinc finger protein GLI4-like n=1 Tax=Struthio camelus TaxID=8801 RepID=UPI003603F43D
MNVVQDSYESVISLAEEIAMSWPRICAFAEPPRRLSLLCYVDMEPPRGQLEPPQGLATTPWSQGLLLPDFRKQLMAIMQTIGQSQVEKMLRELVKEQKQEGRVQWCRRPVKSLGSGAGSRTQKVKEEAPPQDGGVEPTGAWGMFSGMPRGSEQHPALAAQQGPEEAPESPPAAPHGKPARAGALGKARDVPTPPKRWPEEQGRGWGAGCKEGCGGQCDAPPKAGRGLTERPRCCPESEELSASSPSPPLRTEAAERLQVQPAPVGSPHECPARGRHVGTGSPMLPQRKPPCECPACGYYVRLGPSPARYPRAPKGARAQGPCTVCGRRGRHRVAEVPPGWTGGLVDAAPSAAAPRSGAGARRCYPCAECGKGFTQRSALSKHRRIHSGERPHQCGDCGKRFLQRSDLTIHRRRHTGERPYGCPECGRRFSVSSNLAKHRRAHLGQRPFPCPSCGKAFIQRSELVIHQRLHTGERPYRCPLCAKAFGRRSHLTRHQRTHVPRPPAAAHPSLGLLPPRRRGLETAGSLLPSSVGALDLSRPVSPLPHAAPRLPCP